MKDDLEARKALVHEAHELLAEMEAALLLIENSGSGGNGSNKQQIDAIFRAAHTIKGSASLFGFDRIVGFTHIVENVLDHVRGGRLPFDGALVSTLLGCGDYVALLMQAVDNGMEQHDPDAARGAALEKVLQALLDRLAKPAAAPGLQRWHCSLRLHPDVLRDGMDPLALLRHLSQLGEITALETLASAMPAADSMDPETCYLTFELDFAGMLGAAEIADVFEFFREGDNLAITALAEPVVVQIAAVAPDMAGHQAGTVAAHLSTLRQEESPGAEQRSIRIDVEKLDYLIDLVGELVIAGAGASLIARVKRDQVFKEAAQTIEGLVDQLRAASLSLRMVPINEVFRRFPRLVRDMSHTMGKAVELNISGAETELDKAMVDKIIDPMIHIVRNAVAHGIEPAALRARLGKPEAGVVHLSAAHESGGIVIDISDDGGGLDRVRILAKARASGLLKSDQIPTEHELLQLIFAPGFSTAETVTELSGRGVGMDVVRQNIEALHGTVQVRSMPALGTTVSIRLPLTTAIIMGFQVMVGDTVFVMPLDRVVECLDISNYDSVGEHIVLHDVPLKLVSLAQVFNLPLRATRRRNLVVVEHGEHRAGILVDGLMGECQAVIKPLGPLFAHLKGLNGSTILGDGRVALILDIPHLIHQARTPEWRMQPGFDLPAVAVEQ